jgi:CDP-diacylglycerol--glycerol-3-phosphate 3-phosphatidyltransferase
MADDTEISVRATEALAPGVIPGTVPDPPAGETATGASARPVDQRAVDKIVLKVFGWAIPEWVRPNHLTILRLLLVPVILVLLYLEYRWWALAVFIVATCTDFLDGAMARQRRQISTFGVYVDPVADKLLVGAVLAWIGYHYLVVQIFLAFIALELVMTAVGAGVLLRSGSSSPSNVFGKAKMIVQSLALFAFLVAGILDLDSLLKVSLYMLWAALALAAISGAKQIVDVATKRRQEG